MKKGGGKLLLLFSLISLTGCIKRSLLERSFSFTRVIYAKAGNSVPIRVSVRKDEPYKLFLVYSKGLLGKKFRVKMKRRGKTFEGEIPPGKKGDIIFFWIEVFLGNKKIGTLPDIKSRREKFIRGKASYRALLGRVEFR